MGRVECSATDYSPFGAPLPGRTYTVANQTLIREASNDTFHTSTSGWLADGSNTTLQSNYHILDATISGRTTDGEGMMKFFKTLPGVTYRIRFTLNSRGWPMLFVRDSLSNDTLLSSKVILTPGYHEYSFIAAGITTQIRFQEIIVTNNHLLLNNFILEEVGEKDGYRFGFNGQERDDEVAGVGNTMTATFWEYDARLGRRWNLDPKPQVNISDYSVMGDNPILYLDLLGDSKQSRHLDPKGKVIAEYDDGDNSVYKHQTAKSKQDVDSWRSKFKNTSGNGAKIGQMTNFGLGVFNLNTFNQKQFNWKTSNLNSGNSKQMNSSQTSFGGWPKITANIEALAGVKAKVGPIGFGLGRGTIIAGFKDNELSLFGHNLTTGETIKNDQYTLQSAGHGVQVSTTFIKQNSTWIQTSTDVEVVNFNFVFSNIKTNADGSKEESISIGYDVGLGFGLAVNGGIKIPIYTQKY